MASTKEIIFLILICIVTLGADADFFFNLTEIESDQSLESLYDRWCSHFAQKCWSYDRQKRIRIFQENLRRIHDHNHAGNHSYVMGVNQFTSMTDEEFLRSYTNEDFHPSRPKNSTYKPTIIAQNGQDQDLPVSVNWWERGAVSAAKFEGFYCGSCYAFAATAAVEGINQIVTGQLIRLSEQELVDWDVRNGGCSGGNAPACFRFIIKNGGLASEVDYPYIDDRGTCQKKSKAVTLDGYVEIPAGDEDAILRAVAKQPVVVAIQAGKALTDYTGGIFKGPCGHNVNHEVLIVGYGSDPESGTDYWIIKNSWGSNWGENGFAKFQRNIGQRNGLCMINSEASYPVKKLPNRPCSPFKSCYPGFSCCCPFGFGSTCFFWNCCKEV